MGEFVRVARLFGVSGDGVLRTRRERRKATLLFDVTRRLLPEFVPYVISRHLSTVAKASAIGLGAPSICDPAAGRQEESWPHLVFQFPESACEQLVMFCGARG